eukprot:scaffold340_cov256-Pinguiococcus_pyrenoidosus.AAC.29
MLIRTTNSSYWPATAYGTACRISSALISCVNVSAGKTAVDGGLGASAPSELASCQKLSTICEEMLDFCIADDPRKTTGIGGDNMSVIKPMMGALLCKEPQRLAGPEPDSAIARDRLGSASHRRRSLMLNLLSRLYSLELLPREMRSSPGKALGTPYPSSWVFEI